MSRACKVFLGITLFLFLILISVLGEMAQNMRYEIKPYKDYYVVIDTRLGKAEKRLYEKKEIIELDKPTDLIEAYLDGY